MNSKALLGYCTFPNTDAAEAAASVLVQENLIACANILPSVKSVYLWKDRLQKDEECIVFFKTSEFKSGKLKERIRGLHPYENPCLVFLAIEDGLPDFLRWVCSQTV